MASEPSICLYVSKATPTTISKPVPPILTLAGKSGATIPKIIGNAANTVNANEPTNVILYKTLFTYTTTLLKFLLF